MTDSLRSVVSLTERMLDVPPATFDTIDVDEANALLLAWGHRLGACERPFSQRAYAFYQDGRPVSLAISASTVSATVAGPGGVMLGRQQVVELARLCSAPNWGWATRVMIRVWRQVFAPRWPDWRPIAAVSYQQNAHYRGDIYRFDGWEKVAENVGKSRGGGTWSRQREVGEVVEGSKTLWAWRYGPYE
jgi:hypothetical protein